MKRNFPVILALLGLIVPAVAIAAQFSDDSPDFGYRHREKPRGYTLSIENGMLRLTGINFGYRRLGVRINGIPENDECVVVDEETLTCSEAVTGQLANRAMNTLELTCGRRTCETMRFPVPIAARDGVDGSPGEPGRDGADAIFEIFQDRLQTTKSIAGRTAENAVTVARREIYLERDGLTVTVLANLDASVDAGSAGPSVSKLFIDDALYTHEPSGTSPASRVSPTDFHRSTNGQSYVIEDLSAGNHVIELRAFAPRAIVANAHSGHSGIVTIISSGG